MPPSVVASRCLPYALCGITPSVPSVERLRHPPSYVALGGGLPLSHVSLSLVVVFAVDRFLASLSGRFVRWASPSGNFYRNGWPALFRG